jgi:hypothetical protein
MIQLTISNQIECNETDIPPLLLRRIKNDLTFTSVGDRPTELFNRQNSVLALPRGYVGVLLNYLRQSGTPYRLNDKRLLLPAADFSSSIRLRKHQKNAVASIVTWKQGGIVAPCDCVKSKIMLEAMARIQQPALWITHSYEQADRIRKSACISLGLLKEEIGFIGHSKFSIGEGLTVALIQSQRFLTDIDTISNRFGAIFIDDLRHISMEPSFHLIGHFPALYRLWFSSSLDRHTQLASAIAGPVVHTITHEEMPAVI